MRILLVGNYPLDHQPSMFLYADMLHREMSRRGHAVELLRPGAVFGGLKRGGTVGKWLGYIDKYLLFPWTLRARSKEFDVVHVCDHSNSMYLPHTAGRLSSITCHDLLAVFSAEGRYPQQSISRTGKIQQQWIKKHLKTAKHVVCVSEQTAREFKELGARAEQMCMVIHNPLSRDYTVAALTEVERLRAERGLGEAGGYLLHVGGDTWYKNRLGAVRIYHLLRKELEGTGRPTPKLVLAGSAWSDAVREYVREHRLESEVIAETAPSDETLQTLYTGAVALLFPSLYEGFGWPLLEAQSCGCPVITSNRAPMNEVVGDGALLIDPEDEAAAAAKIAAHLDSLGELRERGFRNLDRFAREGLMTQYERFFAGVAGEKASEVDEVAGDGRKKTLETR